MSWGEEIGEVIRETRIGYEIYSLVKVDGGFAALMFVDDEDSYDPLVLERYYKTEEEAKNLIAAWEKEARSRPVEPDWEAQARYDELHGTVNGRDPGVAMWEDAFPYGE